MSEFLQFLSSVVEFATPWYLGLMAASMCLGIIFGSLPGLNATLGVALLIGITYPFGPTTAIIMMMGLYVGAIYAGSLSAILVNIPGTGSAAATCLDGHALARQGKAIDAIVIARLASFVGSMLGVLMFVLFAPLLATIALQFTSAEYFWLCIFRHLRLRHVGRAGPADQGLDRRHDWHDAIVHRARRPDRL